ncbi:hypothetical protein BD311DRAFT_743121 [Dichomitus squalens]|uniref:Uncharacterized protein n=1 Tax=Dichomitus squalens TaxID=114155 RepID=A0A4Q9M8L5_9APHY|nr:hypothetical protein BD311DRAFT_743121 [Dichomitus squalens]
MCMRAPDVTSESMRPSSAGASYLNIAFMSSIYPLSNSVPLNRMWHIYIGAVEVAHAALARASHVNQRCNNIEFRLPNIGHVVCPFCGVCVYLLLSDGMAYVASQASPLPLQLNAAGLEHSSHMVPAKYLSFGDSVTSTDNYRKDITQNQLISYRQIMAWTNTVKWGAPAEMLRDAPE